ncbi:uncharacterized protein LOC143153402 [Ptiloglossa arizonensis]|uniref:uncharacterized protein LOC143153402 n=1 Tax=Ptiloglossa arizonensis TaxID=3350558 RepID=UPI003F9F7905
MDDIVSPVLAKLSAQTLTGTVSSEIFQAATVPVLTISLDVSGYTVINSFVTLSVDSQIGIRPTRRVAQTVPGSIIYSRKKLRVLVAVGPSILRIGVLVGARAGDLLLEGPRILPGEGSTAWSSQGERIELNIRVSRCIL